MLLGHFFRLKKISAFAGRFLGFALQFFSVRVCVQFFD